MVGDTFYIDESRNIEDRINDAMAVNGKVNKWVVLDWLWYAQ